MGQQYRVHYILDIRQGYHLHHSYLYNLVYLLYSYRMVQRFLARHIFHMRRVFLNLRIYRDSLQHDPYNHNHQLEYQFHHKYRRYLIQDHHRKHHYNLISVHYNHNHLLVFQNLRRHHIRLL